MAGVRSSILQAVESLSNIWMTWPGALVVLYIKALAADSGSLCVSFPVKQTLQK